MHRFKANAVALCLKQGLQMVAGGTAQTFAIIKELSMVINSYTNASLIVLASPLKDSMFWNT